MRLNKELKELESLQVVKPEGILTMYLNTDPSDPEQSGGEWKIQLKNSMNSFENYLKQSDDKEELDKFKKVRKQVENFMFENQKNLKKSVIIFASSDQLTWFAEILQLRVESTFYWQETPVLDQLKNLNQSYPKLGIVLAQQNQVKIIEAELGKIVNTELFELDLDTEDWRQFAGPRASTSGKNLQTDQFDKRFEANQKRWYKNLAPTLDKVAKNHNWKKIYLAGEKEEALDLASYMQKEVDSIFYQNILDHEESQVLEKVLA
ncbi:MULTISPECIES: VLRF1 family aeRF1-type release factor [Paraliobacillus]|uniref:VLRF1 family aeRF1-type release factor n=1 Tax=Paraliobacillus TaxID=200903 RepID=UPI000E3C8A2B|nr:MULTISPECIES: VLRF1 family aeRF1-type release factor [Paraliobacillus]